MLQYIKFVLLPVLILLSTDNIASAQADLKKDSSLSVHAKPGMTMDEFNQFLNTDKILLVDFYADWCAPCKMLAPVIEEISKEMKDKVTVVRVNQDENKPLMEKLQVWELPTLQIYKNKKLTWTGEGYFPKEMIEGELK